MTDTAQTLVERLGFHHEHPVTGKLVLRNPDGPEAADLITRLTAEVERLTRERDDWPTEVERTRREELNACIAEVRKIRIGINSQFEAVDVCREDDAYRLVEETLRARMLGAVRWVNR